MKKQALFTAGLAVLLAVTTAFAQGPGRMRDRGPMGPGMRGGAPGAACQGCDLLNPMMARLLNLTDAQKEAIRAQGKTARDASQPLREQLRNLQSQIADATNSGATDSVLDGLANQVGTLQGNLLAISLKARAAIHNNILTAEQRTKLAELRSEQRDRRQNRMKRRQPGTPPEGAPAAPQAPNGM